MEFAPVRPSTAELREAVQDALSVHFGEPCRVRGLRRRRSDYSSSYVIETIELTLAGGKSLSLVFKDLSPGSMLPEARQVRPDFLFLPEREIATYRLVLDAKEFGTPIYYGSIQQPELKRYWLFLERVEGPLLWQVGRFEQWQRAARWLARLHNHFDRSSGHARDLPAHLVRYDTAHCHRWIERAERFVSQRGNRLEHHLRARFRRLADHYDLVVKRLLALPHSLIHGEFYPSNVILRSEAKLKRICAIDWEVAAVGPSLIDLAALTSGNWSEDEKTRIAAAYHEALEPNAGWPPPLHDLLELVDYCQLYLSVQWLGWASEWVAPKHHEQNWLDEALRLAQRVGF